MPTGKSATIKKQKFSSPAAKNGKVVATAIDPIEDLPGPIAAKSKIPLEIEDPDVAHPIIVEEKVEEDPLIKEEGAEDAEGEEVTLDEEELNPFGDKWEQ